MRLAWLLLCTLPLAAAPVELSLKRAVQLAVSPEGNARVQLTAEALKQAESRTGQARAALLPDLSAAFTDQNRTSNLGAMGIQISARSDVNGSAEQVAAQVARAYLTAVRADADVESSRANVTLSEAVLKQAENQKAAGTGTGIEVTRARVQLDKDRQRLLVAENARRAAGLQLLRGIGLRLDTELVLTDK